MSAQYDVVCFSQLRWDFVTQRPHHLLRRCAQERRVFFIEPPLYDQDGGAPELLVNSREGGRVQVVVPHLPQGITASERDATVAEQIRELVAQGTTRDLVFWFYTPLAIGYASKLPRPSATVYDCMDELSLFSDGTPEIPLREATLFKLADLVFTGGESLYELKAREHHNVHLFPSSIDFEHFEAARHETAEPLDQVGIPHPRIGFFGVLDERLDRELLARVAERRPQWQFVMVGPLAKIAPSDLPHADNLHYLGPRSYAELPSYIAGWDVAILPFARNEATRFISPTKTPEYLAAGRPVVSTSIRDVVRPYGEKGLVQIADSPNEFVMAIERALVTDRSAHLQRVDAHIRSMSWDRTWQGMSRLIQQAINDRLALSLVETDEFGFPEESGAPGPLSISD